jgi:cytoskeletal protein RodZ
MVHTTQLIAQKGKEMYDAIGVIFLLFIGGLSVVVIGALAIWIADTTYQRRIRNDKQSQQKTTD